MVKVSAIIQAAGSGSRFGEEKQFKILRGRPLWAYTLDPFIKSSLINEILFIVPETYINTVQSSESFIIASKKKEIKVIPGGPKRTDSVLNGLYSTKKTNDLVCIHDAARPFIRQSFITETVNSCKDFDGAVLAIPSVDTVKVVKDEIINKTIDRTIIWMAQTPQTFHRDKLLDAFKNNINVHVTDESVLMELSGYSIKVINGDAENFKITNKLDWELAKLIVGRK